MALRFGSTGNEVDGTGKGDQKMIAIVNYGSGNLAAISNIYKQLNISHAIVEEPAKLAGADRYILPGVGHFDYTMRTIRKSGMFDALQENVIVKGKPILGICIGMQVLANSSEEGDCSGLGWIPGRVRKIQAEERGVRLPHMGWNSIAITCDDTGLFNGVDEAIGFYFLHSYYFDTMSTSSVLATTDYGGELVCGVTNMRNIFGLQFHPEKSHRNGIVVFKNFAFI